MNKIFQIDKMFNTPIAQKATESLNIDFRWELIGIAVVEVKWKSWMDILQLIVGRYRLMITQLITLGTKIVLTKTSRCMELYEMEGLMLRRCRGMRRKKIRQQRLYIISVRELNINVYLWRHLPLAYNPNIRHLPKKLKMNRTFDSTQAKYMFCRPDPQSADTKRLHSPAKSPMVCGYQQTVVAKEPTANGYIVKTLWVPSYEEILTCCYTWDAWKAG